MAAPHARYGPPGGGAYGGHRGPGVPYNHHQQPHPGPPQQRQGQPHHPQMQTHPHPHSYHANQQRFPQQQQQQQQAEQYDPAADGGNDGVHPPLEGSARGSQHSQHSQADSARDGNLDNVPAPHERVPAPDRPADIVAWAASVGRTKSASLPSSVAPKSVNREIVEWAAVGCPTARDHAPACDERAHDLQNVKNRMKQGHAQVHDRMGRGKEAEVKVMARYNKGLIASKKKDFQLMGEVAYANEMTAFYDGLEKTPEYKFCRVLAVGEKLCEEKRFLENAIAIVTVPADVRKKSKASAIAAYGRFESVLESYKEELQKTEAGQRLYDIHLQFQLGVLPTVADCRAAFAIDRVDERKKTLQGSLLLGDAQFAQPSYERFMKELNANMETLELSKAGRVYLADLDPYIEMTPEFVDSSKMQKARREVEMRRADVEDATRREHEGSLSEIVNRTYVPALLREVIRCMIHHHKILLKEKDQVFVRECRDYIVRTRERYVDIKLHDNDKTSDTYAGSLMDNLLESFDKKMRSWLSHNSHGSSSDSDGEDVSEMVEKNARLTTTRKMSYDHLLLKTLHEKTGQGRNVPIISEAHTKGGSEWQETGFKRGPSAKTALNIERL